MMCTMDRQSFYAFTKNTLIGDFGAFCHITNNDKWLYNVSDINKSVQGSSGSMSATEKVNFV